MPERNIYGAAPPHRGNGHQIGKISAEEVQSLTHIAEPMQNFTEKVGSLLATLTEQLSTKNNQIEELTILLQNKARPQQKAWWRKLLRLKG